jgi:predicted GIY-YIG superfamily endonuclease
MSTNEQGYVYCIADEHKRYKLGFSQNVDERIKHLQTGNADKLTILYRLAVNNMHAAEIALHALFTGKQLGEWFRISDTEKILLKKVFGVHPVTPREIRQLQILGLRK